MSHTYTEVTKSDNSYSEVSDVRPIGTIEDKLTWTIINPNYDTWEKLLNYGKIRWSDWYYGTPYTDDYTSLTTPSYTYQEVSV